MAWAAYTKAPPRLRARIHARWDAIGDTYDDVVRGLRELQAMAAEVHASPQFAPLMTTRPTRPTTRRRGAGRPGARRTASRGGDDPDDGPPPDPAWPRRVASHVALDLAAGQPRTVVVPDLADCRRLIAALDVAGVAFGVTIHDNNGRLAVTFSPRGVAT